MGSVLSCDRSEPECLATQTVYDLMGSMNAVRRNSNQSDLSPEEARDMFARAHSRALDLITRGAFTPKDSLRAAAERIAGELELNDFYYVTRQARAQTAAVFGRHFSYANFYRHFVDGPPDCTFYSGSVKFDVSGQCGAGLVAYLPSGRVNDPKNYECVRQELVYSEEPDAREERCFLKLDP